MAKKFREPLGRALRRLCPEPQHLIPFQDAVALVLEDQDLEEGDHGARKDGRCRVTVQIQTAFRWLKAQGWGYSHKKGYWSLTTAGWQEFSPEPQQEDDDSVLWEWISPPACWSYFRADLDSCKACLVRDPCRSRFLKVVRAMAPLVESGGRTSFQVNQAYGNGAISALEHLAYQAMVGHLPEYQIKVSAQQWSCLFCSRDIESGVPFASRRGDDTYHIPCAIKRKKW